MVAYEVSQDKWVYKLAANLVGKAQEAYAALSLEEAKNYNMVKEAILRRYDITDESYRQRFRLVKKKSEESYRELATRLADLAEKWLKTYQTRAELLDQVVLEQFLKSLPDEVRVFVKERKPTSSEQASKLADDFRQARKEDAEGQRKLDVNKTSNDSYNSPFPYTTTICHRCKKPGHLAKDCRATFQSDGAKGRAEKYKRDRKDITCFNCQQKGHYSSNCPSNAMLCVERRSGYTGSTKVKSQSYIAKPGVYKSGKVEGRKVTDILLDTGCSRTVVRQDLVPEQKKVEGEAVAICCTHGDTVLYPLAQVEIEIGGQIIEVEAAISETLPMSMLLGTDVPSLSDFLTKTLQASKERREQVGAVTGAWQSEVSKESRKPGCALVVVLGHKRRQRWRQNFFANKKKKNLKYSQVLLRKIWRWTLKLKNPIQKNLKISIRVVAWR